MRRSSSEVKIADRQTRFRTRIEDDPSPKDSWAARCRLLNLFEDIITSPDLISCGLSAPQKLSIYHSGTSWVIEAEAVLDTEG